MDGRWQHPARQRRWRRNRQDRLLAGVAGAVARRTGRDVTLVRIAFVLAALANGVGLAAYVLAWLVVPAEDSDTSIGTDAVSDGRGLALAAAATAALVALGLAATSLGVGWVGARVWPSAVSLAGLVLIWRNGAVEDRAALNRLVTPLLGTGSRRSRVTLAVRMVLGSGLLAAGLALLQLDRPRALIRPLDGVLLVLGALVVVFGPWWLRIARDLGLERAARARAEERADLAARVHDSVLQTLALIQRRADQPQQVVTLARAQERELRSWLLEGRAPGSGEQEPRSVSAAVRRIQQDVESAHGVTVEAVTVGDAPLDERLTALLAAAREATTNAAKWSGAPVVSVFAEVTPEAVAVFVRDRGRGFDPATVPADRLGLAESVHGRMARHGGSATVRSRPGEGAEVALRMPRTAGHAQRAART